MRVGGLLRRNFADSLGKTPPFAEGLDELYSQMDSALAAIVGIEDTICKVDQA